MLIFNELIKSSVQAVRRLLPIRANGKYIFIVGAQKAGTSALHNYLLKHPGITGGDEKEIGFFSRDVLFKRGYKYYRSKFRRSASLLLDATPEYLYYKNCAERIQSFAPDAKIIILLRDPVERAFSAFNMYQQLVPLPWFARRVKFANKDGRDFYLPFIKNKKAPDLHYYLDYELELMHREYITEEPSLIRRGIYSNQLERFHQLFGKNNVLVLFSIDLKIKTAQTVSKVIDFIGLSRLANNDFEPIHAREYRIDQSGKESINTYAGTLFEKDKVELIKSYSLPIPW